MISAIAGAPANQALSRMPDLASCDRGDDGHARGGGRGDDDLQVGQPRLQRLDEMRADVDFTDADRVHPERVAVGDGLLEFGVVPAESLAEAPAEAVDTPMRRLSSIGCRTAFSRG